MEELEQDVNDIQPTEEVEATTSEPEGETPETTEPTPDEQPPEAEKPLTRAELEALRNEWKQELEQRERHWQSVKDREVKAASSEARENRLKAERAESVLKSLRSNPQYAPQLRNYELQSELEYYRQKEAQEAVERDKTNYFSSYRDYAESIGVSPEDERIDWALDAKGPVDANKRILASIAKIQKENKSKMETELDKKVEQRLKDHESKMRKDLEIDKVDNSANSGSSSKDPYKLFANGEITIDQFENMINK